jgi:hypothetical protein
MSFLMIIAPRKACIRVNLQGDAKVKNRTRLVLEQPQRTLNNNVLEDGARRDING